ncbi:MAG: hypothetical protein Kow0059_16320 [Candidatus Sumerlaeia bacterium]
MKWSRCRRYVQRSVLVAGASACAWLLIFVHPRSPVPPDRVAVTLWQVTGAEDEEPQVPKWFNESQDSIFVQPVGLPFLEIEQKFLTAAVGNFPPDLFEYFGSVAQWSTRGALRPLDDLMERDGFDRSAIFPALWDEMMWDGRTYAIPTGTACEAFFWNKAHFREAGLDPDRPPRTWAELEEYAVRLTRYAPDGSIERAGYIPGYWSAFGTPLFLVWQLQLGARFISEDGRRVIMTEPANVEALKWEARLFERLGREQLIRKRSSFGYGAQHGFLSGQVSMIVQKSSFPDEINKFAPDLEYGCSDLPLPPGGRPATLTGAVWIGIPAGARHPEEAWDYIKYLTRSDVQRRSAEWIAERGLASFFPANVEAATGASQLGRACMSVFVESMKWGRSPTVVPLAHTQFWRASQEAWDSVMRGLAASPEAALAQAERTVQKALDEQLAYNEFYRRYLLRHGGGGARHAAVSAGEAGRP